MMEILEAKDLIGLPESERLEYKAVLPTSQSIARIVSAFANTEGGYLVLGVRETGGGIEALGLSQNFPTIPTVYRALSLLTPNPNVQHGFIAHDGKSLFVLAVEKSETPIHFNGKIFNRVGDHIKEINPVPETFAPGAFAKIVDLNSILDSYKETTTESKNRVIDHYKSVLKIILDMSELIALDGIATPPSLREGRIMVRILFSSCVDNFETYLSELLYEIYLAKPETLKSEQQVSVKEVLECDDIEDFVKYWARKKIMKLQKGSVKGFIKENKHINALQAMEQNDQEEIERILQIRHLYSHRNGIVDEKFLAYFPEEYSINDEHLLSVEEIGEKVEYLASIIEKIDVAAIQNYSLSTL
jgi:hypothetical protein